MWSCGIILYAMCTGRMAFSGKDLRTLSDRVITGQYRRPGCTKGAPGPLFFRGRARACAGLLIDGPYARSYEGSVTRG